MNPGRPWTRAEVARLLQLRKQQLQIADIAKILNRSAMAVRVKLIKCGYSSAAPSDADGRSDRNAAGLEGEQEDEPLVAPFHLRNAPMGDEPNQVISTFNEDLARKREELRDLEERLRQRKVEDALKAAAVADRILEIFRERIQGAPVCCHIPPPCPPPAATGEDGIAMVLLFSDWHFGQVVSIEQTNGFGYYNPRVAGLRLHYLQQAVLEMLQRAPFGPVGSVTLILLGDLIHGCLNHGAEREETVLVADQVQTSIWLLYQFVATLATVASINIYGVTGNHGRWPGQKKMPTVHRYSNLDQVVADSVHHSLHVAGLSHVHFSRGTSARQLIEVNGTRFQAFHGDQLRGGDRQFAAPIQAMGREVVATTQRHVSAGLPHVDYWLCGDKHKHLSMPVARGGFIINGSFVGIDEFAMAFPPAEPVQIVLFVHKCQRVIAQVPIKLEFANLSGEFPYEVPSNARYLIAD